MNTTNSWRFGFHYSTSDLIEYLRRMRRGEPLSITSTYLHRREVLLQATEMGLVRLPEGTVEGDAHTLNFSQVTILNDAINKDE